MIEKIGASAYLLFVTVLVMAGIGGWIANVVKLIGMIDGAVTAMFIARIVGVFFAPLGSILGFL